MHIVTSIIENICVLLDSTKENFYIGSFWSMMRMHVVFGV